MNDQARERGSIRFRSICGLTVGGERNDIGVALGSSQLGGLQHSNRALLCPHLLLFAIGSNCWGSGHKGFKGPFTLEVQALERSLHNGRIILCSCSNDPNSACHLVDAQPILVECCLGVTFLSQEIKNTNKLAFTTLTRPWAVLSWDPRKV